MKKDMYAVKTENELFTERDLTLNLRRQHSPLCFILQR